LPENRSRPCRDVRDSKPSSYRDSKGNGILSGLLARLARDARALQAFEVAWPVILEVLPEFAQHLPGVDAGIMAVIEHQPHGVIADRLDARYVNVLLADHQDLRQAVLRATVAAHLGGRRKHAPVPERQLPGVAPREPHHEQPRAAARASRRRRSDSGGGVWSVMIFPEGDVRRETEDDVIVCFLSHHVLDFMKLPRRFAVPLWKGREESRPSSHVLRSHPLKECSG